jgi:hypothetical protein
MRATVLRDEALVRRAGQFVWLSVNVERGDTRFLERYPVPTLPAYFVIDPARERIVKVWKGVGSVADLLRVLDEATSVR